MWPRYSHLSFLFLWHSLFVKVKAGSFCFNCCICGDLAPHGDPYYILTTQQLEMYCYLYNETLTEYGLSASDLELRKGSDTLPVEILNETTLIFNKTMDYLNDAGTYNCRIKDGKRQNFSKNYYVKKSQVIVESYPVPISPDTVHCVVYDWDVNLICSWRSPDVIYIEKHNVKTTVYWSYHGNYTKCGNIIDNRCTVDNLPIHLGYWHFKFVVNNTRFNIAVETNYMFIARDRVKPSPVSNFTADAISSNCIRLTWNHHRQSQSPVFEISYRSQWDYMKTIVNTSAGVYTRDICNLIQYTEYVFNIGTYPDEISGYRSDLVNVSATTLEYKPAAPPEVKTGSYVSGLDLCGPDISIRNVTVYWKSVPEKLRNGNMTGYFIKYKTVGDTVKGFELSPTEFSKSLNLLCDKSYEITIQSMTKVGLSEDGSTYYIPGTNNQVLHPPNEVIPIIISNSEVNVSWKFSESNLKIKGFTVYWCQYRIQNMCKGEIEWKGVRPNESSTIVRIDEISTINLLFGVSIETNKVSSGFKWESCIYKNNAVPRPPLIELGKSPPNNGLTVTWAKDNCDGDSPYLQGYKVRYCTAKPNQTECAGKLIESRLIPSQTVKYDIDNLEPGKSYLIKVRSVSQTSESVDSESVHGVPENNDLSPIQLMPIVVVSGIVFILCIAGAAYCLRYCITKSREVTTPYEITVPHVDVHKQDDGDLYKYAYTDVSAEPMSPDSESHSPLMNGAKTKQLSTDSGHESESFGSNDPNSQLSDASESNRSRDNQENSLNSVPQCIDQSSRDSSIEESSESTSKNLSDIYKSKIVIVLSSGDQSGDSSNNDKSTDTEETTGS